MCEISCKNSERLLRKWQKNFRGYFLCRTLYIVMSLGHIFGYISPQNWTDLDKTWQKDGEWGKSDAVKFGEIASGTPEKAAKNQPFSWRIDLPRTCLVTSALPISTKLRRKWDMWIGVRTNPFTAKFWKISFNGRFSPKPDFSAASVNFEGQ